MDDDKRETFKKNIAQYDYVRLTFCDLSGQSRCKLVPARVAAEYMDKGVEGINVSVALNSFCEVAEGIKKCADEHYGNTAIVPVLDTLHDVPWSGGRKYKVGSVLCETKWMDGSAQDACPRYVARKQLEKLAEMGYTMLSGIENEFMLYQKGTKLPLHTGHDFCVTATTGKFETFLFDLDQALNRIGISVHNMHVEYAPGQFEFICQPKFGLQTADETFIFREAVKEISNQHGWDYNFMSRPVDDMGSGTHLNLSLWDIKGEQNVFYDADKPDKLSDICRYFVGGILKHIGAVTALCSPTVNCYRRLHAPWVPDLANWGIDDRQSSFRIKNYSHKVTLIENRIASGLSNPYLITAVTVAAGIDGIKNKIEPPPIYQRDAPPLCNSLEESLTLLEKDEVMVEALGAEFIEWFIVPKREFDLKKLKGFDPKVFSEEWQDKEWNEYSRL